MDQRIRIHTKMSWIRNTASFSIPFHSILTYLWLYLYWDAGAGHYGAPGEDGPLAVLDERADHPGPHSHVQAEQQERPEQPPVAAHTEQRYSIEHRAG